MSFLKGNIFSFHRFTGISPDVNFFYWLNFDLVYLFYTRRTEIESILDLDICFFQYLGSNKYVEIEHSSITVTRTPKILIFVRSSRLQMFFQEGVLKNLSIFTGKHLCWSLLLKGVSNTGVFLGILRNF